MLLVSMLATSVLAADIEVWTADDFPRDGGAIAGNDGWESGWNEDPWVGYQFNDGSTWASPYYDYGDGGQFGDGGPHDNWLVHEAAPVTQGLFSFNAYVTDNDSWGIVFGHASSRNLVLVLVCGVEDGGDNSFCPTEVVSNPSTSMLWIHDGDVEILGSSRRTLSEGDYGEGSVSINDGEIRFLWGEIDITAPLPEGVRLTGVGFYGYNEGFVTEDGQSDNDTAWFNAPSVAQYDDDGDRVADDEDNCEKQSNPGQEDADGDGIGAACDEDDSVVADDTGSTDSGNTDSGNGNGGGDDPPGGGGGVLTAPGECACSVADPSLAAGALLAVAALLARRRRA